MTDCDVNPLLSPYYDGELDAGERRRVEAHLPFCPECAAELEKMKVLSAALASMAVPQTSPDFVGRLQAHADRVQEVSLVPFVRRLTAVAAALLALAVCRLTFDQTPATHPAAALTTWERVAIDPEPGNSTSAPIASTESQFDEFMARDLSGGVQ